MTISFGQVPQNLRTPGVFSEVDSSRAVSGVQLIAMRLLLIGQKTAAGTATADQLSAAITSVAQARTLFGPGSMLAIMAEAALASNSESEIRALVLADSETGVAAAGEVSFAGPSTAAGSVSLYIGGKLVQIAVPSGMTAAQAATALAAAITADTTLPVAAAVDGVDTAQVNITAKNDGTPGNSIDLRLNYAGEETAAGLVPTIVAMAAGANNPVLTTALGNLSDEWLQVWAMAYTDSTSMTAIKAELASRFDPMREVEAQVYTAARDSLANLQTLGNLHNSPHVSIVMAGAEPMPTFAKAAEAAAIVCRFASIDPARPLQYLPFTYCLPPTEGDRLTRTERNLLLYDGIATTSVDAGGVMQLERMITTYKTNAAGGEDTAYLDSETLFTLMTIRHDWRNLILTRYPRHKLASDGTRYGAGQAVVTPNVIKGEAVARFRDWEELGLVENAEQFKADLIVERSTSDPNRLNALLPPDLINQLRIVGNVIAFRL